VLLALSLAEGAFGPTSIWNAAHVDEDVQMEIWGQDTEALERRAHREIEFRAAATILAGF
jgi:chaperone required for assembly of F1-ATPase